ncbi:MAG: hypothetical protein LWX07_02770 [Bacteroidetes bacterium]|nr:hypothetical protein [Bacteroidota bacterium]
MKFRNLKYFSMLFVSAVLLLQFSSCLEIERNIKINADGSGTESQRINIDRTFYDMMIMLVSSLDTSKGMNIRDSLYNHEDFLKKIRSDFENTQDSKLMRLDGITNSDSSTSYFIEYSFNRIEALGKMTNTNPDGLGGESRADIKWEDRGSEINFSLKYKPQDDGDNSSGKEMGYMFEGKQMRVNIEFPYDIISTNASNHSGRNAKWVIDMKNLSEDPSLLFLEARLKK